MSSLTHSSSAFPPEHPPVTSQSTPLYSTLFLPNALCFLNNFSFFRYRCCFASSSTAHYSILYIPHLLCRDMWCVLEKNKNSPFRSTISYRNVSDDIGTPYSVDIYFADSLLTPFCDRKYNALSLVISVTLNHLIASNWFDDVNGHPSTALIECDDRILTEFGCYFPSNRLCSFYPF